MLGENTNWVCNLRAADGRAVLRHGHREAVNLQEAAAIRAVIRDRLALSGAPQMLLQLGLVHTAQTTGRRPASDLIEP